MTQRGCQHNLEPANDRLCSQEALIAVPLPNRSRTTIITMWNNELTNRFLDSLAQLVQLIDTSTGAELDYPGG